MNRTLIVTLTALTLGTATLGTAALAEDAATTVTLPGTVTTSVKDAWAAFATAGGKAELLGADGSVIGTLNADGTITVTGTATLSDVKSVTLTPATGDPITVKVTRDLSRLGAIKIEFTDARGRTQSLPLPAVVNRLKAAAPGSDDADESGEDGDKDKSEKSGKDDKDDKGEKGGKPSTNPGKGRP